MKALKIAWLAPYPVHTLDQIEWARPPKENHPCSWIINLAAALGRRHDVELHVITLSSRVRRDQSLVLPAGYTLHVLNSGIPHFHRGYPVWFPLDALTAYEAERKQLTNKLRSLQPDIVHAHGTEYAYGLAAMDAAGYPWVVSMQGIMTELVKVAPSFLFKRLAALEQQVITHGRYFMGRTHYDKGFVRALNPTAQIFDVPEAIHPVFFEHAWNNPSDNRVLFVGSSLSYKGLPLLIQALGRVRTAVPDVALDVVGNISEVERPGLEHLLSANGLSGRVVFHGFQKPERIAELHRQCKVFVLPSLNENSPNTLMEALVSGMPVIAHDVGGVSSMFDDGKSGLLVKRGDTQQLAAAIVRVLQDTELRQRLGRAAREQAQRNRPDRVAEVTVLTYRRILDMCAQRMPDAG